jgi:hypothetical protein
MWVNIRLRSGRDSRIWCVRPSTATSTTRRSVGVVTTIGSAGARLSRSVQPGRKRSAMSATAAMAIGIVRGF